MTSSAYRNFSGLVVAVIFIAGCSNATFEGKSVSEWLRQAKDKDEQFRADAVLALGHLTIESDGAKKAVLNSLNDESKTVRVAGVRAIGELARSQPEYIKHLVSALKDRNSEVRLTAIQKLAIGPSAHEACLPLANLLDPPNELLRSGGGALPEIIDVDEAPARTWQDAAIATLESMGAHAKPALPALTAVLENRRKLEKEAEHRIEIFRQHDERLKGMERASKSLNRFTGKPLLTDREFDHRFSDNSQTIDLAREQWATAKVRADRVESAIQKISGS